MPKVITFHGHEWPGVEKKRIKDDSWVNCLSSRIKPHVFISAEKNSIKTSPPAQELVFHFSFWICFLALLKVHQAFVCGGTIIAPKITGKLNDLLNCSRNGATTEDEKGDSFVPDSEIVNFYFQSRSVIHGRLWLAGISPARLGLIIQSSFSS